MTPTRDIIGEFKALRLHGMAATWADLCEQNSGEVQGTRWLIEPLLRAELTDRATRSVGHQMSAAKFPVHRDLAGFDFAVSPVDRKLVTQLAETTFTEAAHNVVLGITANACASTARSIWSTRWSRRRLRARPGASPAPCCAWTW
jgi:hypothetical protein